MDTTMDADLFACRLCSSTEDLVDVGSDKTQFAAEYRNIVKIMTGIRIIPNDRLLSSICRSCLKRAIENYDYRRNALQRNMELTRKREEIEKKLREEKEAQSTADLQPFKPSPPSQPVEPESAESPLPTTKINDEDTVLFERDTDVEDQEEVEFVAIVMDISREDESPTPKVKGSTARAQSASATNRTSKSDVSNVSNISTNLKTKPNDQIINKSQPETNCDKITDNNMTMHDERAASIVATDKVAICKVDEVFGNKFDSDSTELTIPPKIHSSLRMIMEEHPNLKLSEDTFAIIFPKLTVKLTHHAVKRQIVKLNRSMRRKVRKRKVVDNVLIEDIPNQRLDIPDTMPTSSSELKDLVTSSLGLQRIHASPIKASINHIDGVTTPKKCLLYTELTQEENEKTPVKSPQTAVWCSGFATPVDTEYSQLQMTAEVDNLDVDVGMNVEDINVNVDVVEEEVEKNNQPDYSLVRKVDEEIIYICDHCHKVYKHKYSFNRHKRIHLRCVFCRKMMSSREELKSHVKDKCPKRTRKVTVRIRRMEADKALKHLLPQHFLDQVNKVATENDKDITTPSMVNLPQVIIPDDSVFTHVKQYFDHDNNIELSDVESMHLVEEEEEEEKPVDIEFLASEEMAPVLQETRACVKKEMDEAFYIQRLARGNESQSDGVRVNVMEQVTPKDFVGIENVDNTLCIKGLASVLATNEIIPVQLLYQPKRLKVRIADFVPPVREEKFYNFNHVTPISLISLRQKLQKRTIYSFTSPIRDKPTTSGTKPPTSNLNAQSFDAVKKSLVAPKPRATTKNASLLAQSIDAIKDKVSFPQASTSEVKGKVTKAQPSNLIVQSIDSIKEGLATPKASTSYEKSTKGINKNLIVKSIDTTPAIAPTSNWIAHYIDQLKDKVTTPQASTSAGKGKVTKPQTSSLIVQSLGSIKEGLGTPKASTSKVKRTIGTIKNKQNTSQATSNLIVQSIDSIKEGLGTPKASTSNGKSTKGINKNLIIKSIDTTPAIPLTSHWIAQSFDVLKDKLTTPQASTSAGKGKVTKPQTSNLIVQSFDSIKEGLGTPKASTSKEKCAIGTITNKQNTSQASTSATKTPTSNLIEQSIGASKESPGTPKASTSKNLIVQNIDAIKEKQSTPQAGTSATTTPTSNLIVQSIDGITSSTPTSSVTTQSNDTIVCISPSPGKRKYSFMRSMYQRTTEGIPIPVDSTIASTTTTNTMKIKVRQDIFMNATTSTSVPLQGVAEVVASQAKSPEEMVEDLHCYESLRCTDAQITKRLCNELYRSQDISNKQINHVYNSYNVAVVTPKPVFKILTKQDQPKDKRIVYSTSVAEQAKIVEPVPQPVVAKPSIKILTPQDINNKKIVRKEVNFNHSQQAATTSAPAAHARGRSESSSAKNTKHDRPEVIKFCFEPHLKAPSATPTTAQNKVTPQEQPPKVLNLSQPSDLNGGGLKNPLSLNFSVYDRELPKTTESPAKSKKKKRKHSKSRPVVDKSTHEDKKQKPTPALIATAVEKPKELPVTRTKEEIAKARLERRRAARVAKKLRLQQEKNQQMQQVAVPIPVGRGNNANVNTHHTGLPQQVPLPLPIIGYVPHPARNTLNPLAGANLMQTMSRFIPETPGMGFYRDS